MARTDLWTNAELEAALGAYLSILADPKSQATFSPTILHRTLVKGALHGRTEASVGRRMSNISTVLKSAGEAWITRYPASLPNVGSGVTVSILALLKKLRSEAGQATVRSAVAAKRADVLRASGHLKRPVGNPQPSQTRGLRTVFVRDPHVVAWVLQEANGVCEACDLQAPFQTVWGAPYLEVHHVLRLADGGPDVVENAAALCPNCHRRLHHSIDAASYRLLVIDKVERLSNFNQTRPSVATVSSDDIAVKL